MIASIIFSILVITTAVVFGLRVRTISRNIALGRPFGRTDRAMERFILMCKVAIGQSKMVQRPVAGLMHILVYVGFIIINIEVLEIIIDGVTDSHRSFLTLQ